MRKLNYCLNKFVCLSAYLMTMMATVVVMVLVAACAERAVEQGK